MINNPFVNTGQLSGAAAQATDRLPEIQQVIDELRSRAEGLSKVASVIVDKIACVSRLPEHPITAGQPVPSRQTPVGSQLQEVSNQLEAVSDLLHYASARLEL